MEAQTGGLYSAGKLVNFYCIAIGAMLLKFILLY